MPRKINETEDARLAHVMGAALRAARKRVGLTQAEVATRANTASEVYGRAERGVYIPSIPMLLAFCRAMGAQPNELLGMAPVPEKPLELSLRSLMANLPNTPDVRRLLRHMARMQSAHVRTLAVLASQLSNTQPQGGEP